MTRVRRQRIVAIAAALIGCLALARTAAADPPDRVGRVSQVIGPVSFRPATLDEWGDAVPNYPLTSGDNLWADRAARAELQLGGATARLGADTSFGVLNLDDRIAQFRLTQGSVALSVNDVADQLYEVDTPNGAVSLLQPGFYRIDVNDAGDSTFVTVRRGEADVTAGDGRPVTLHDNQSVSLIGLDTPRMDITGVRGSDEWEDWCRRRDQDAYDAVTARYVSPYTVGYSDLDDFGTWRNVDRYGPVWIPRVHNGWAPYHEGRWVWVEPWGWTWVDDQPWGFAPSHYGRWVNLNGSWGWWPGARVNRAIYAPALVAFIGNTVGRGLLSDSVAWFPLGPDEPYVPTYRVSPTYLRAINVADVRAADISVTRVTYVNRVVPGAVTAVPRGTFVSAAPVKAVARALPADEIREAPIVGTAPSVAPAPSSVVVKVHDRVAMPQAPVMQRRVVAKTAPPPLPVPFTARESAMKDHPGRPVDPQTLGDLRARTQPAAAPPVRVVTATAPAQGQGRQGANPVAPAVGQEQPPRGNGRPRPNEAVPTSTERSAPPPQNTNAPPERQEESRTTAVPKRVNPPTPPEPPQPPQAMPRQNSDDGRLAAQQAAERARLEAQHAAEQDRFEAQRAAEQKRAQDAQAQAQLKQQEEQQKRQMDDRQVREHQQLQQQQQAEKARQHQAPEAKPQQQPQQPPEAKAPRGQSGKGPQQKPTKPQQQKPPKPKGNDGSSN
jgi:hypothetical protein